MTEQLKLKNLFETKQGMKWPILLSSFVKNRTAEYYHCQYFVENV